MARAHEGLAASRIQGGADLVETSLPANRARNEGLPGGLQRLELRAHGTAGELGVALLLLDQLLASRRAFALYRSQAEPAQEQARDEDHSE